MLLLLCAAVLGAPQGPAWPQYRGPDRTGIVDTDKWSVHGAAEPLWSANVGKGYSCPSIADGRLVTMGFDEKAGVDRIVCLNAISGAPVWQHEFAASDKPKYHGGGTLTTPTLHDGRVYCINRVGRFHVLDLDDGSVLWTRDYGTELKLENTFHGFSASPLLEDERIYVQLGGLVVALDANNGDVLWRSKGLGDAAYSNPAMLDIGGTPALAAICETTFFTFARDDGRILHEYPWRLRGSAVHCAVPIPVGDDRVFLSTAYNKGAAMLRLGDDKMPEKIWSNRLMRNKVTACVLHEEHLYGFDESMLRCLDMNGKSKWRVRGLGLGSLSMAGGRLLVLTSDGELIVAEADPKGFRELSRKKVLDGGVYWTMPVLVDGLIYVRNSLGDLRCLDHRSQMRAIPTATSQDAPAEMPDAASLFAAHAAAVGREAFTVHDKALRMRGTWAIPVRGIPPQPMTLTLAGPDRWRQTLHDGVELAYDGTRAWAIETGGRILEGDERFELQQLFPLSQLFVPNLPSEARVRGPVKFGKRDCWKVTMTTVASDAVPADTRAFYFEVKTGRLRGSDGARRSTLVLHGSQRLAGLTLPQRITRYAVKDGQEHIVRITAAEWVEVGEAFARPVEIQRLLRSPAEVARATAELTKRFGPVLARYKPSTTTTRLGDTEVDLKVRDGELWFQPPEEAYRVCTEAEENGAFPIEGIPVSLKIVDDKSGGKTIALLLRDGHQGMFVRVTK